MSKPKSPIASIRKDPVEGVLETIRRADAQTVTHVRAFLERCNVEIINGTPLQTLLLCNHGPDYVKRVPMKNHHKPDFLVWSYGILGTCCSVTGLPQLAEDNFARGYSFEEASPLERAGLMTRHGHHKVHFDWSAAHELVDQAVKLAQSVNDHTNLRDGKSPQFYLSIRAAIRAYGADEGLGATHLGATHHDAAQDYQSALAGTDPKRDFRTRQFATIGLARLACQTWLAGYRTLLNPAEVLATIYRVKKETRKKRLPTKSLLDCCCRWTEAMALVANEEPLQLTYAAEKLFRSARRDFDSTGRINLAVQVTMDMQWAMILSGRYADALAEFKFIKQHEIALPEAWTYALHEWERHIRRQNIPDISGRFVFKTIRGIANVIFPEPQQAVLA